MEQILGLPRLFNIVLQQYGTENAILYETLVVHTDHAALYGLLKIDHTSERLMRCHLHITE